MRRSGKHCTAGRRKGWRYSDNPFIDAILEEQFRTFRKEFGREPGEGDPVFFDPEKDTPTFFSDEDMNEAFMFLLKDAPPNIVYAYKKTGRILLDDLRHQYPPDAIAEFGAPIAEYFELEKARKLSKN